MIDRVTFIRCNATSQHEYQMTDSNGPSELASLVPNVGYDLIARIIPGSSALFLFYRIRFQSPGVIELAFIIILIYLVGFSLEKISVWAHSLRFFRNNYKNIENKCFKDFKGYDQSLSLWNLAYQVPQGSSLKVGKMFAELQLFKSLSVAFLLYGFTLLIPLSNMPSFQRLCIFTQQCGDLRRLLPGWPGFFLFLVLCFLMWLFACNHFKECCLAVRRYLNSQQV